MPAAPKVAVLSIAIQRYRAIGLTASAKLVDHLPHGEGRIAVSRRMLPTAGNVRFFCNLSCESIQRRLFLQLFQPIERCAQGFDLLSKSRKIHVRRF